MNRNPLWKLLSAAVLVSLASACGLQPSFTPARATDGRLVAAGKKNRAPEATAPRFLHVLPDERDTFLLNAVARATRGVKLQVYMLTHPGLIDALVKAHRRGLQVKVLLEEKPYNPGNPNNPLPTNRAAFAALEAAGVAVRWTDPGFRFTHAKAVTLDDAVTYVSTANFTKSGLNADGKGAREYIVEDRVPQDVAEFVAMFEADWERRPYTPVGDALVVSPTNSRQKIFDLIRSARKDVFVQVEVAGDPELDALLAAKVRQGVRVRALLADLRRLQSEEEPGLRANIDVARTWRDSGVEVLFQKTPHLHAKAVQVDGGRFYVGSVNMTTNSMNNNRELGLLIDTPALATRLSRILQADFARALPIPPAVYTLEAQPGRLLLPSFTF